MYFSLSLRNVRRSLRDYAIYLLTLTLAVCIFYVFNSVFYPKDLLDLSTVQRMIFSQFSFYISIASALVSFIFGSLIIYANNFIIKKRRKEFGLYMSLGMSRNKISLLLLCETFILGCISMIMGFLLGVIFSQALMALHAKLLAVKLPKYEFTFSEKALVKTIICFGSMFLPVAVFNFLSISKYKLVDLFHSSKENKRLKMENIYISAVLFLISIICLGFAYDLILQNGIYPMRGSFFVSIILGSMGTFLFFMSLSTVVFKLMETNKNFYLKGLNVFLLRQFNRKLPTTSISMTVICVMLAFTISILSTGLSLKDAFQKNITLVTPFDASISIKTSQEISAAKTLKELGLDIHDFTDNYTEYYEYDTSLTFGSIIGNTTNTYVKNKYSSLMNALVPAIKISDYNQLMKMQGQKDILLNGNEVLFISNNKTFIPLLNEFMKNQGHLKIEETDFRFKFDAAIYQSIETTISATDYLTMVLPDDTVKTLAYKRNILCMNYSGDKAKTEKEIMDAYEVKHNIDGRSKVPISGCTRITSAEANNSASTLLLYISIYIALVLIIAGAAVLALQRLSEAPENVERYETLKKMGVDAIMINRLLFIQILIHFTIPLFLAIVHSIVGILVIVKDLAAYKFTNLLPSVLLTSIIIFSIYGGYFFITYKGYKNILNRVHVQ